MKIAFVSDDGITISRHFGRATYYVVVEIENGTISHKEIIPKSGHNTFAGQHNDSHEHSALGGHGFDAVSQSKHASMLEPVRDCVAVIAGGMGAGLYANLQSMGILAIVTDKLNIEEAAAAYLAGTLENHIEYLH